MSHSSDHQTLLVIFSPTDPKRTVYHWKRKAWNHKIAEFRPTRWDLPNKFDAAVDSVTRRITTVTNKITPRTNPTMTGLSHGGIGSAKRSSLKTKEITWRSGDMVVYAVLHKKAG